MFIFLFAAAAACSPGAVFSALGALQESCRPPVSLTLANHGLGVDLMPVVRALVEGLRTGTPVRVNERPWHYAKGVCPSESLRCFFKPVVYDLYCSRRRMADVTACGNLEDLAFRYLTQPTVELDKAASRLVDTVAITKPCVAIHVRRTDTLLNDGWDHKKKLYKWVPLSKYVEKAEAFEAATTLLLTDDATAIRETQAFKKNWQWIDRPRHSGTDGGWENHFPSGDRTAEMAVILALRRLTAMCGVMVGSKSSFGRLMYLGMRNAEYVLVDTRAHV